MADLWFLGLSFQLLPSLGANFPQLVCACQRITPGRTAWPWECVFPFSWKGVDYPDSWSLSYTCAPGKERSGNRFVFWETSEIRAKERRKRALASTSDLLSTAKLQPNLSIAYHQHLCITSHVWKQNNSLCGVSLSLCPSFVSFACSISPINFVSPGQVS